MATKNFIMASCASLLEWLTGKLCHLLALEWLVPTTYLCHSRPSWICRSSIRSITYLRRDMSAGSSCFSIKSKKRAKVLSSFWSCLSCWLEKPCRAMCSTKLTEISLFRLKFSALLIRAYFEAVWPTVLIRFTVGMLLTKAGRDSAST